VSVMVPVTVAKLVWPNPREVDNRNPNNSDPIFTNIPFHELG